MKQLILLITITITLFSCENKYREKRQDTIPVVKINVNEIESDFADNLSEVFEPIDIIPLETKQESFVGGASRIKFYGDNIYVFDKDGAKGLLVFSKNGKFKYKIGNIGKGPGEYLYPKDFDIYKDEIRILDLNKIVVYDISGKFKKEFQLDFLADFFATVSDNYDVYYGSGREDRIIIANKNGKKLRSFYKYSPRNRILGSLIVQRVDSTAFINIPICDTVFAFKNDSLFPFPELILGVLLLQIRTMKICRKKERWIPIII